MRALLIAVVVTLPCFDVHAKEEEQAPFHTQLLPESEGKFLKQGALRFNLPKSLTGFDCDGLSFLFRENGVPMVGFSHHTDKECEERPIQFRAGVAGVDGAWRPSFEGRVPFDFNRFLFGDTRPFGK